MVLCDYWTYSDSSDLQINKDEDNIRSCKSYVGSFPHTHRLVFVFRPKQMTSDLMSVFAETPISILEIEQVSENHKHVEDLMEKLSVGPVLNLTSWRLWRHENHEVTERRRSCSGLNTAGKCLNKKTSSGFMLTNVESLSWTLVCGFTEWDETCVVETSITQLHTTFVFCRNINNI